MRFNSILRVIALTLVICAFALTMSTCCGNKKGSVVHGFSPGSSVGDKTSPEGLPAMEGLPAEAGLDYREDETLDEALMELDGMECPEGVDEALFEELKDALGEALEARASSVGRGFTPRRDSSDDAAAAHKGPPYSDSSADDDGHSMLCPYKSVATPPSGDNDRVLDLSLADHYDTTYTLTWSYRNLGDYDQNGTVGISDITPLAIHYGEDVPEGDDERNTIQAVIDGSENDKVDIADITPIAMYYGTECAAYSIRAASSHPESIEDTSEIDTAPVALAEGDDRKIFSVELVLSPRTYIAVAPMDADETPGELSSVVLVPNHAPVAELTADPMEGDAPLDVSFNASGSSDIDGPIAKYEWDWEGDGVYDHDSGSVPTAEHTYDIAEAYDPQVRVTDEHNGTDTASVTVTAGTWRIAVAVDGLNAWAEFTCLEVVTGHPAISFYRSGSYAYVRANDAIGESWGNPVLVHSCSTDHNYHDNSLVVVNGHPAIAFYEWDKQELWYARANDADGSSWGTPMKLAYMAWQGDNSLSMAIVNGHPAIAYQGSYEGGGSYLLYVRALDANGESWGSPMLPCPRFAQSPSLLVVNGAPVICYNNSKSRSLHYARALDADGAAWGDPVTVDSEGWARFWSSLAIVNGNPAICYEDENNGDLKYVRANDPNGNT